MSITRFYTMETTRTNRGGVKLCHGRYTYTKKATNKSTIRWECAERRTRACKGTIITDLLINTEIRTTDHNHDSDIATVEAVKIKASLKRKAADERGTPGQLLSDSTVHASVEVRAALGNCDVMKRTIRRERARHHPKNPATTDDLIMDDEWKTTGGPNPQQFVIYDSGRASTNRMIVFATDIGLQHLARSDVWMMDGTFDVAPTIFTQLYVIRAPLNTTSVSCVYALLSDKLESTYNELLTAVLNRCKILGFQPDPQVVISDFEKAALNSVSNTLGDHVRHQGCFYHLTQATWRKVQSLGLTTIYRADEDVRHFCGMLDGLAFLPVDDVPAGMQHVRENMPTEELQPLLEYFDATYVTGKFRSIQPPPNDDGSVPALRVRRASPTFAPDVWNVHDATVRGGARTNNMCEAWNRGFSTLVGHSHPTVWTLIDALRRDCATAESDIFLDNRGQPPAKRVRRTTVRLQDQLRNLCLKYDAGNKSLSATLQEIGHCIRLA